MVFAQRWADYRRTWNISKFPDIPYIYMDPEENELWTPDIHLTNEYVYNHCVMSLAKLVLGAS